jgi:hypothetical protein
MAALLSQYTPDTEAGNACLMPQHDAPAVAEVDPSPDAGPSDASAVDVGAAVMPAMSAATRTDFVHSL